MQTLADRAALGQALVVWIVIAITGRRHRG